MKDGRNKKNREDNTTRIFEMPYENKPDNSKMILSGNKGIFIENHCGIIRYTEKETAVAAKLFDIYIKGDKLVIGVMNKENIVIKGEISQIDFKTKGEKGDV